MKKTLLSCLLILLILLISCEDNDKPISDINSDSGSLSTKDDSTSEFLNVQDTILKNYSNAIKFINQIDSELTKLANVPSSEESVTFEQDIIKKIDYLSFQLKSSNEDIRKLEIRLKSLGSENKVLLERIKTLEEIMNEKDIIIEKQKERIALLENELQITKSERDIAFMEKENIERYASDIEQKRNTAYYIIGNEDELKSNNIIKMEGKGFLGIGGKYVPSPEADLKYFTRIDITQDSILILPNKTKIEEIVSSHNIKLMNIQNSKQGETYIQISEPNEFWRTDKLLIILVEEK